MVRWEFEIQAFDPRGVMILHTGHSGRASLDREIAVWRDRKATRNDVSYLIVTSFGTTPSDTWKEKIYL